MGFKEWFLTWFKAARAPFLVVSFIPCLMGGAIAYAHGSFDLVTFILVTIGIVCAHSAGDFVDDYFDYKTGNLGNKEQQFHDSPLIHGKITLKQVMVATLLFMGIAIGIGVYLYFRVGTPVLVMALIGTFIVLFYTSPPLKLNYRGLGETMLFIAFGPLIVVGVYYVLTGHFSLEAFLVSLPVGIFTMNVGLVSNTFDYSDDVLSGKKCIPVRFGQANASKLLFIVTVLAYCVVIVSVLFKLIPVWALIGLVTMPLGYGVVKATLKYEDTSNYTPAMSKAIALSSVMGLLLVVAYVLQIVIHV
jgi:1,4-dihydroxy-2-naphthoate polyprenyltransferase